MKRLVLGSLIACVVYGGSAWAVDTGNCKRPTNQPAIPKGASATEADMVSAKTAVKKYTDDGQAYLDCLKNLQAAQPQPAAQTSTPAGAQNAKDATDELVDLYNAMIDDMHAVAGKYNEAVKDYKASAKK